MRWDSTAWIIMTFSSPCGLSLARKPAHLSFILAAAAAMAFYPCHADDDPGSVFPQPAYRAEQFVDFIGLNASPFDKYLDSGPYKGAGTKFPPELFFDLGVRHYRCGLKYELTLPDAEPIVEISFSWFGKPANRMPEALWLTFQPAFSDPLARPQRTFRPKRRDVFRHAGGAW